MSQTTTPATYTVTEVAELLGVHRPDRAHGELPVITLGRRRLVSRIVVERLLNGQEPHGMTAARSPRFNPERQSA